MDQLKVFENSQFGSIRTLNIQGDPWFVGKDPAEILGYNEPNKAIVRHVFKDDRMKHPIMDSLGREQETWLINESGLYALIFGSKMEEAEQFKRWVTSEVLPSIRKTGGYIAGQEQMTDEQIVAQALLVANNIINQKDKQIEEMKPKAEYYDSILKNKGLVTTNQIAKDYGMSAQEMNKLLNQLGVQYKQSNQWLLYSKYHDKGYTHSYTFDIVRADGRSDVKMNTKWTQKGRMFIYDILKGEGILPMIEQNETQYA